MKTKLLLLMMVLLGIAAGAKAYSVQIGNYELEVGDYFSRESGLIGLESGYIHYDEASHLTLENVELCFNTVEGLNAAIMYLGGHLTITLIGENKIYGAAVPTGIISTGLTIDGTGSLDIVATNSGISVPLYFDNFVIDNAHVKAKGGTYGIRGANPDGQQSTGLRIHGDGILEAYGGTQCFYAIDGRGASGAAIMSPSGAKFSDYGVVDASNNPIKNQWVTLKNGYLVDSTNFPDANFRNWILAQSYGKDGILTDAEIANVTSISVNRKNIADLKGIELFTALKELSCNMNQLSTLDIKKNTALTYLDCSQNKLTGLNIQNNKALTYLNCYKNNLTSLYMNNSALTKLNCSFNKLTTLQNLNNELKELYCDDNQLTSLNVSSLRELTALGCSHNQLRYLSVTSNTKLEGLTCGNNQLTTLNVSNNTALLIITCESNQLTTLDVSNNTALEILHCYGNAIRDEGMQTLVNSLCDRSALSYGQLIAYYDETSDGNEITGIQVEAAKLKNWKVQTFSDGGFVDYPGVEPITLDQSEVAVEKGKTVTLKATVSSEIEDKSVTWKSSNTSVATVTNKGVVKGIAGGIATITCTSVATGRSATCKVIVGKVSLSKYEAAVEKGKTVTLTATVYPSSLSDRSVTWKSSNTAVATVTSDGKVTGVGGGTATITGTSVATGLSATCKVTVGKVSLGKSEVAVEKGKTVTLTATVYPSSLSDKSVTWKSSKTSVATVTRDGKVTGVAGGTATITCTSVATGFTATCKVTVGKVSLSKSEVFVEKGKTTTLTATVYPSTLEDKSMTWKSSNTAVATVNRAGVVTGVGGGTATITGTSNATGFTATCKVTVGKVSLGKSEVAVEKGKTVTLTATVYPSSLSDRSVTWKSSSTSVATVTSDGKVTGVGGGTATITCTSVATGFTATCKVTVGKVSLSKYEVAVEKGKTTTLTATVYPSSLENKSVTWKSSNTAVATVTSDGKVKGVTGGTATITCTSVATGFTATCQVTVTESASARTLDGDDEEVTGIETVEETPAVEEPFDVYDLRGHKVLQRVTSLDALPAGIYIVNGKKVLKK